jgi:hypothetical protein
LLRWARIKISRYRNRVRKVINAPIEVAAIPDFLFRAKPIPAAQITPAKHIQKFVDESIRTPFAKSVRFPDLANAALLNATVREHRTLTARLKGQKRKAKKAVA